uniref:Uncharacterized protein n=1 Tax=Panagrolaimus sp. ES5 TaxID=591445 RepID=A0AC34FSG4_9BILA
MKRSSAENEGFLLPDGSVRRVTGTEHFIPVSPDMKNARHRLGNLLSGIRKGDIGTFGDKDEEFDSDQGFSRKGPGRPKRSKRERSFSRKGPGRPKRSKRERRIIYELRNKVFSVRDSYTIEPIYPLMRKWIYGCDDELPPPSDELPASPDDRTLPGSSSMISEDSLDLLATKEIHKMPEPLPMTNDTPPMKICSPVENPLPEGSAAKDLLKENLTAWKNCKKQHKKYMEMRELKYEPSLKLLKTVHAITQQTTQ